MLTLLLVVSCSTPNPAPAAAGPPLVVTTSFPADWLVARLAGEAVRREHILPPGQDPPDWQPPGEAVARAQEAALIVANGAGYEAWMATASLPEQRVVFTAAAVSLIEREARTHSHGAAGAHSHAGADPHTWSDPQRFAQQAAAAHGALARLLPAHQAELDTNLAALEADLRALDGELRAAWAPLTGRALAENHPAFDYLAQTYGFELHPFELDAEAPPNAVAAAAVARWAEAHEAPVLLWEAAPNAAVQAALSPRLQHVVLDPLEQPGPSGTYDYLAQARANVAVLRERFPGP